MPTIAVCKPIESVVCVYLLFDRANPGRVKLDACENPADTCSRAAAKKYSMIKSLFIFRTRLDVMWTVMSTITIYRCRYTIGFKLNTQDFRQAASRPSNTSQFKFKNCLQIVTRHAHSRECKRYLSNSFLRYLYPYGNL
jgi:hypothetical protein